MHNDAWARSAAYFGFHGQTCVWKPRICGFHQPEVKRGDIVSDFQRADVPRLPD